MPINPAPGHFSTSQYKSTLFETKMACIENIAKIQHRQLNYQSIASQNCDMLIKTFDLWWLELSEVPPNPASIPSATSLAREWLAKAIISHSILTLSGWWVGGQGFQTGTAGWLLSRPVSDSWSLGMSSGGLWQAKPYSTPLTWCRPVGYPVVGWEADFIREPQMLQPP